MPRTTGGPGHARKRTRVLTRARGFRAGPGTIYRHFRTLWITRLNAALKQRGVSYNRFIPALAAAGIELNRKMLSELAVTDPGAFDAIVELARPHRAAPTPSAQAKVAGAGAGPEVD